MTNPKRRELITEIRQKVVDCVPGFFGLTPDAINAVIDEWRDGATAFTPAARGIFNVCDQIARDLDAIEKRQQEEKAHDR